ncbi:MAG: hypothetical protein LBT67_00060, partial [Holosporaceae bacterium]|nr:hypothetical protein [Holosporaceae bacterium]
MSEEDKKNEKSGDIVGNGVSESENSSVLEDKNSDDLGVLSASEEKANTTVLEAGNGSKPAPNEVEALEEEEEEDEEIERCTGKIEDQITTLIATGHMFKAHAIAKKAFNKNPNSVNLARAYALVLLKTGAVEESRKLIYPILKVTPQEDEATGQMMATVEDVRKSKFLEDGAPETIAGLGHIFRESWKYSHHCRDLEISRELYLASFQRDQKTSTGINAAWLSWLTGDDPQAKQLSASVLKLLPPFGLEASFRELIDLAEAQLLIGREDDACKLYEEAMKQSENENYISIVAARQQLYFLREAGFKVPNAALEILTPPTIVVFTGHAID